MPTVWIAIRNNNKNRYLFDTIIQAANLLVRFAKQARTATKECRVLWKIYIGLSTQTVYPEATVQLAFRHINKKMYRLGPDVSIGFGGLHHVGHQPR